MPKKPPKDYIHAVPFPEQVEMKPIGVIRSPYTERHGTPRQSVLRHSPDEYSPAEATIELFQDVVPSIALKDMEGFSRIWVLAWLHLNKHWNPTVTPPRGPKIKRGTLATRAPHRPNPIGLSAPELIRVEGNTLVVRGIDLLDGTPILDIKPYVTYCDAFPQARSGYVDELEAHRLREKDILSRSTSRKSDN